MTLVRVVRDYGQARSLGASRDRFGAWELPGGVRCLSTRTIRDGGARGLFNRLERVEDPDGLLTDGLRGELAPGMVVCSGVFVGPTS